MKKVLLISGHPNLKASVGNAKIISEFKKLCPEAQIRLLDEMYPDYRFDDFGGWVDLSPLTPKTIVTSNDAFDPLKTYSAGEWLIHQGVLYEVLTACTGVTPPNATYYAVKTLHDLKDRVEDLEKDSGWININERCQYRKIGHIVTVSFQGPMTFDSKGYLIVNDTIYHLPQNCRPSISMYTFVAPGGGLANNSYLIYISTDGVIYIYRHQGDTSFPEYCFGSVSFPV